MAAPQAVKLPNELLDRADALVDYVQSLPEIAAVAGSRVTRAHVIRLALALAPLERDRADGRAGGNQRLLWLQRLSPALAARIMGDIGWKATVQVTGEAVVRAGASWVTSLHAGERCEPA